MSNTKTTHLQWLQWINGSWYYEHNVYAIVLSDFEVDQDNLTSQHKEELDKIASVFKEADLWNNASIEPEEITYDVPFGVGKFDSVNIREKLNWPNLQGLTDAWQDKSHIGIPLHDEESINIYENAELANEFIVREAIRTEISETYPHEFLKFQGGASQTGTDDHNDDLSWRRAEAVRRYLWETHSIDAADLGETEGLGENEPYIDAVAEGLDDIEIDKNRYARFIFSFTFKVVVLDSPDTLQKRLLKTLRNIDRHITEDKEVHRDHAIGKFSVGINSWKYVKQFPNSKPTIWYPDETVKSEKTPLWIVLEDNLNDFAHRDRPVSPNFRCSEGEEKRNRQMMHIQDTWPLTASNKRKGWEKVCKIAGENPSIRFGLILDFISEEKYRTLMTEEDRLNVNHFFDAIEEFALKDHFERISPNFLWLDLELNKQVKDIQEEANTSLNIVEIRWVLPEVD